MKKTKKQISLPLRVSCAYDEIVALGKLKPHPKNPNRHPPAQIALLAKIIQTQGWRAPIVVSNRSGFIVAGHGRLMAAQFLEERIAPVDYQDFDSDAEELAHLLADNKIPELAEMDDAALRELIQSMDGTIDLDLTGFDSEALEQLLKAGAANDPNSEWGGMPEFSQEDLLAWKNLIVNFANIEDLKAFAKLVGQSVGEKTRSIWFPKKEKVSSKESHFENKEKRTTDDSRIRKTDARESKPRNSNHKNSARDRR